MQLKGSIAVLVGGATGIGATLVEQFAAQEARVGFVSDQRAEHRQQVE